MPKHKHTRDKLYYTQEEMRLKYFKNKKKENTYYFLPFNYCCVSLRPLNTCKNICCDREGNLYNKFFLLEYVTKFHKNPVTGKKHISLKDIVSLNIAKDKNGNFICPVTLKALNNSLKIIAIPETGNVFSNMAYQELNVSMNNYRDLINDKPFDKKNVIVINDPLHKKVVKNFYFQNIEQEKEYMNKLVNNKKEFDRNDNERNILLDYKYKKIVKDVEKNDDENNNGVKTLKDNNLIYEEEKEDEKNNNKNNIEGYDEYLLLKEKIKVIINLIRKKGLTNNNIYNNLDEDLYKSMLDLNYEAFYCFMVKENLWEKYFKFTDLNSITHSDKLTKNNKMSITSTFFQAREDKNINKKEGIPLFNELKDIYFSLIKKNQLKTYMILTTNISVLNIELWSTRLTETVEKIYNILSNNLDKLKKINYMKLLDDEFLVIDDISIDIKIEKDKKVQVDKNIIKGPYVGYMVNHKKICFFTNKNKYVNKTDIYVIGTVFDKEEKENILDEYFDILKSDNQDNEINIIKLELINNPFLDAMKDILFQEIKQKYLSVINNNEINNDIKIMKELEKNQNIDKTESSVGKYINNKMASNVDYDIFQKFLNNES